MWHPSLTAIVILITLLPNPDRGKGFYNIFNQL